jgi:dipeptidyl-peptidase-4
MQKFTFLLACLLFASAATAQEAKKDSSQKDITLTDIWTNYSFFARQIAGFNFRNDGNHYSQQEKNQIISYNLATGQRSEIIYTAAANEDFDGYSFSADEQKILLETESEQIYRHSSQANFFIYDLKSQKRTPLSSAGKQRYATFNPQGDKVAFVRNNNLYYKDLNSNKEVQITKDGLANNIINGATDWVYEEEFAIDRAFFWSPDGQNIGFIRFDESQVKEFRLTYYLNELYPDESVFKYPKAGEENAIVSVYIYNLKAKKSKKVDIGNDTEQYVPRLKWTNDNFLCIYQLNRAQNRLNLLKADPKTAKTTLLLAEENKYFININDDLRFLEDGRFLWTSERSGFNHVYLFQKDGKLEKQLTKGNWDVTQLYGYDAKNQKIYFQAAAKSPIEREIYSADLATAEIKQISTENGTNNATFSSSFAYYVLENSNVNKPATYTVYQTEKNNQVRLIEDNKKLLESMKNYRLGEHKFFTFVNTDGVLLHGAMITPPNFDTNKKYPVFMTAYGGPGRQMVLNEWGGANYAWYQMLAEQGYIVVSVDGRGTDARGEAFSKATYKQLGKYETIDQIEAAKYLANLPYVDGKRIGIFGWSFGGYLSTLCLAKGAEIFKMAIAVAPVIHWKWYDSIYTERYMDTPKNNPTGYDDNSPLNFAQLIKGKYLLVHGTGDDNVHAQNAFEMSRALVEKNIPFEQAYYTNKNHGIYGGATRFHLYQKMTDFILNNL